MKNHSADYIELSVNNNDENDDPPDLEQQLHGDQPFEKEEDCKPTTALLTNIEQEEDSSSDDFVLYENEEHKSKPKHESTLAVQVNLLLTL